MAIAFTKYVDITSAVGAGANVPVRELIGRLFSTNTLIPTGAILEFSSLESVGDYFGTTSDEYKRANLYFNWVSKSITSPQKISFCRWVNANTAPMIFGKELAVTLGQLQLITNGAFSLTLGGVTHVISGLDFSTALTLADVATAIESRINLETGTQWTAASVTYNASRGSFDFVGGDPVVANVIVAPALTGTDIATTMGWYPLQVIGGAIWSKGSLEQSVTDLLSDSTEASNNFGSYIFMDALTQDQIVESATWNAAQNVKFQYYIPVTASTASAISAAVFNIAGCDPILTPIPAEYAEMQPMLILAATNYLSANATQNYMFQVFPTLTPSVTTTADSNNYDNLKVGYYGSTQQAGVPVNFFQRGVLMGGPTDPLDMNTYANEQWLQDAAGVSLMQLLLTVLEVAANPSGVSLVIGTLEGPGGPIEQALSNGTFSVGKILTTQQILYINEITGDSTAWRQVQNNGYWLTASVNDEVITYTLVYSKKDVIRKITGRHVLI